MTVRGYVTGWCGTGSHARCAGSVRNGPRPDVLCRCGCHPRTPAKAPSVHAPALNRPAGTPTHPQTGEAT